jgi:hypothetical protein
MPTMTREQAIDLLHAAEGALHWLTGQGTGEAMGPSSQPLLAIDELRRAIRKIRGE